MEGKYIEIQLYVGSSIFTYKTTSISDAFNTLQDVFAMNPAVPFTMDKVMEHLVAMKNGSQTSFTCKQFSVMRRDSEV